MTLAEKIAGLRRGRKLSQGDLAEKLDVSRQSVSKWETGQAVPELDKLVKLADLFGVTVDELVRDGDAPQAETPPAAEPEAKIVHLERKGLTPVQIVGGGRPCGRRADAVPWLGKRIRSHDRGGAGHFVAAAAPGEKAPVPHRRVAAVPGELCDIQSIYQRHTLGAVGRDPGAVCIFILIRFYSAGIPNLPACHRHCHRPGRFGPGAALFHRSGLPAPVEGARTGSSGNGQPD